jgi:hypothetical protein
LDGNLPAEKRDRPGKIQPAGLETESELLRLSRLLQGGECLAPSRGRVRM